jgi:tRNA nucleotidyltransferase (CCA-adding enzyme)
VIPTGIEHGTVTVLSRGTSVEVTTYRTEGAYVDGRRPERVEFHDRIEADLSRRDFTVNAMAFDPLTADFRDPFGGLEDLGRRLVRCVGEPLHRFGEDGLRALRAVRFAAVLGFSLDPPTQTAIPRVLHVFRKVSAERILQELSKLLTSPNPRVGLELLRSTGLLGEFLPEVLEGDPAGFSQAVDAVERLDPDLELRLAALVRPLAAPQRDAVLRRLKLPNRTQAKVKLLLEALDPLPDAQWTDAQLRALAARIGPEHVDPLLTLARACTPYRSDELSLIQSRARAVLEKNPPLIPRDLAMNGEAIMKALAVGPSPVIGAATRFLMQQVIEEPRRNTREQLQALLLDWARSRGA